MRAVKIFWLAALLLALAGCATGVWTKENAQPLPPLDPGKGRVFIYRGGSWDTTYIPDVLLNGVSVGKFNQVGVILVDVPPGSYAVATTISSKVANFGMATGEKRYVKLTGGFFDKHMHPELIDATKGEAESSGLRLLRQVRK